MSEDTMKGRGKHDDAADDCEVMAKAQSADKKQALRISPLFNDAFLMIFGRQDSKHVAGLLANAVLRQAGLDHIGDVRELRADAASAGGIHLRTARTDVLVVSDEGDVVDLEAQSRRTNLNNKMLFYGAKLLCEHTKKGGDDDYNDLPRIIVIALVEGHTVFEGEGFVTTGSFRWGRGDSYMDGSDRVQVVVVELDKIKKCYTANDVESSGSESLAWLYLLADGYRDEVSMGEIMEYFPTIREFAERYNLAMDDPDLRKAYELYEEARLEYNTMLHEDQKEIRRQVMEEVQEMRDAAVRQGRKEGREEGREEGRKEGRREVINRLRELGYSESEIDLIARELRESGSEEADEG